MQEEDYFIMAVIRHRFGYMTAQVAQSLLHNSNQTVEKLISTTSLPHESVAAALTAMLQHDIVACQGPYEVSRPPKLSTARTRGRTNTNSNVSTETLHSYDVNTSLEQYGDIATRLYGNTASGYVETQSTPTNTVSQPILPITKIEYDQPQVASAAVTNYLYSINRGMVRGLSRTPFYAGLVTELVSPDAKLVIDEFIFRGKLTLSKALQYVIERMVADEDAILRLQLKLGEGVDPSYTANDFNMMSQQSLESLSIWAFDRARLIAHRDVKEQYGLDSCPNLSRLSTIGGINTTILKEMDDIELSRYEKHVPRAVQAFDQVNKFFLLVESPGFLDPLVVDNATITAPTNLPPVSQPLDGITPSLDLQTSLESDFSANSSMNNNTNTTSNPNTNDRETLQARKRKAIEVALANNTASGALLSTPTPVLTTSANSSNNTSNNNNNTSNLYDDDEDLFDDDPVSTRRTTKRSRPNQSGNNSASGSSFRFGSSLGGNSGFDQSNASNMITFSAYQSPLQKEQRLYILNHDRFTLLHRGEMFFDFISSKVGLTAGLLIGGLNFDSLRHENPTTESCDYSIPMMKKAFMDYAKIKQKQFNPNLFLPQALENVQQQITQSQNNFASMMIPQTPSSNGGGNTRFQQQPHQPLQPTPNNIHGDYTSPLNAAQHLHLRPVVYKQLQYAVNRLTRSELAGSNNLELQFLLPATPSQSTLRQTRTLLNQEQQQQQQQQQERNGARMINEDDDDWNKSYLINFQKIAQAIRKEYLLTHLFTRWGSAGRRVIGTLLDHSRLEEKQISDFSLVPKRDVKEILHTCLQDGIVDILDVPTSSDRLNPSKVFYLWGMDYIMGGEKFLAIFYKSFANLILRLDVQRDQSTQLIDKMLLQKHMDLSDSEAHAGRDYKLVFARFMHVLHGTMKVIIAFKDLCPK